MSIASEDRAGSAKSPPAGTLLVRRISHLATHHGPTGELKNAAIYCKGNEIKWVGLDSEIPDEYLTADQEISLEGCVVIPGLTFTACYLHACYPHNEVWFMPDHDHNIVSWCIATYYHVFMQVIHTTITTMPTVRKQAPHCWRMLSYPLLPVPHISTITYQPMARAYQLAQVTSGRQSYIITLLH